MAVRHQRDVIAERGRPPAGRVDAQLCLHAGDDEHANAARRQLLLQAGSIKSIRHPFLDHQIGGLDGKRGMQRPASGARLIGVAGAPAVLHVYHWNPRRVRPVYQRAQPLQQRRAVKQGSVEHVDLCIENQ